MTTIALIPARGNSRRLPRKNLAMLGDKTLLQWTIDAALDCAAIDHVYVSSDNAEIIDAAEDYGARALRRPDELARHDTPSIEVVRHAAARIPHAIIVLLQPTSPFRTAEDIQSAIEVMDGGDGVVSVTEQLEPGAYFKLGHANRLRPTKFAPQIVTPNGAIYGLTNAAIARGDDWWTAPVVYGYLMPEDRSIDIDTQADLDRARARLAK